MFSSEAISAPCSSTDDSIPYESIPCSKQAEHVDSRLDSVWEYLTSLQRPEGLSDDQYTGFICYCLNFFVDESSHLWRKDVQGCHRLVIPKACQISVIRKCHDQMSHKGIWATTALIQERFWWPKLNGDVKWFLQTCHLCQLCQMEKLRIPPVVAEPLGLFTKCYIHMMEMPLSGGFKYLIHSHCLSSAYPKFHKLRRQTGDAIATWIFIDILCHWGALQEIITNNGTPFLKALDILAKRYGIHHITISTYNSQAAGVIEQQHFNV